MDKQPRKSFRKKRSVQTYGDHDIGRGVKLHRVQTPYGEDVFVAEFFDEDNSSKQDVVSDGAMEVVSDALSGDAALASWCNV